MNRRISNLDIVKTLLFPLRRWNLRESSQKTFLSLAFFCLAALNLFFFIFLVARTIRLPSLVLMSPFLDWTAWVASGSGFAWICFTVAGSKAKRILRLGGLIFAGSVLQVLPTALPKHEPLLVISSLGGVLMSLAVIASTTICIRDSKEILSISSTRAITLLSKFFLALAIPLQVWSIATMSPLPIPLGHYPEFSAYLAFERLFRLVLPITVALFVSLMTEWLWVPIALRLTAHRVDPKATGCEKTSGASEAKAPRINSWILVGFSLLIGIFLSIYQWSRGYPLGSDAEYYLSVLDRMNVTGFPVTFSTDRPVFFIALYSAGRILGLQPQPLLRLVPMALTVVLVGATYYFTRFVGGSRMTAALATAFAAVSPQVTVGVDYFIVANWLGIPLMMLFVYVFLRSIAQRSVRWTLLTIALSVLVLGLHYFTWLFMILIILGYSVLSLLEKRFPSRRDAMFCLVVILGCIAVLIPVIIFAYVVGGELLLGLRVVEGMRLFLAEATPANFIAFLLNRERVYSYFATEHYAIPLLYILTLTGFATLSRSKSDGTRIVKSWLTVCSIGILIVPYNEWWRFLYMIPFGTLAAFGIVAALQRVGLNDSLRAVTVSKDSLYPTGLQLALLFMLGATLTSSILPSWILLSSLALTALVESLQPEEGWRGTAFLLIAFLLLEQIARAIWALI